MLRNRKGKQDIRYFKRIVPVLIVVISILLFRGTGICSGGMGGMHADCGSNFHCSSRYFCEKADGYCQDTDTGKCEDKPRSCNDIWDPVCGCDESTYPNKCEANRRGISIDYVGQCIPGITLCDNINKCPTESYCQESDGSCSGQGTCGPRPAFCPEGWDPVCGCDENTYSNKCEAAVHGVNVSHEGECSPGVTGCTNDIECSPDSYCQRNLGSCSAQGTCALRPVSCAQVWDPVCGCDGMTYSNDCEAAAQGVNVDHNGACTPEVGANCFNNSGCSANFFCRKAIGSCVAQAQGTCVRRPHMCPKIWEPVCGCDGTTYSSECESSKSGVTIKNEGECKPGAQTCTNNNTCPTGFYCKKAFSDCTGQGECVSAPEECPDIWSPVCGCNETTYSNECYAAANGINLDYVGECSTATEPCTSSSSCSTDEYCKKGPGKCATGEGECVTKPEVCVEIWEPVCGCDGKTYANECKAAVKGVNVNYAGECEGTGPACLESSVCPTGMVCQKTPGRCSELGICSPAPTACPEIWTPVCGCDGKTYSSGCKATSLGANIDYSGQCSGSGTTCVDNNACQDPGYCNKTPGDCAGQGTCMPKPEACALVWDPVCGCNGQTYPNECEAESVGINIDYIGECSAAGMWCQNNLGCPSFAYCKKDGCTTSFGKCTVLPEFCIQVDNPVCGCDGKTYSNGCVAASNGINIRSAGACPTVQPPPGYPYGGIIGGFIGGIPYGGYIGGPPYGGIIGGIIGGYIGGSYPYGGPPYGGIIGGVIGGYIGGNYPYGGTPYGGIIGGGVIGGYIGGSYPYGGPPYGGIIGGVIGGYIGGNYPYGGTPYGGIIGGVTGGYIGGYIGGNYPYGGTPYGGIIGGVTGGYLGGTYYGGFSGTRYPTTIY